MAVQTGTRSYLLRTAVSLCILLTGAGTATNATAQSSPEIRLQRSAPAGFEALAAARHLQLAVILDNVRIGSTGATVDLESIVFDDPAAVALLVPNAADRTKLAAALSAPLALNAGLVCNELAPRGCGRLTPEVAGVIYDAAGEAVQLFVNPGLRKWAASLERLRPQDSEPALLGSVRLGFSGRADGSEPLYSLALDTVGGLGATHVRAQGLLRNQRSDLDQLYARHIAGGFEQVAGLFTAGASSLLPAVRLLGVRFGTTLDDLPAEAGAYDVPLIVALASPATIDAFVGERLIASARYRAGDARIDTSSFPAGAYLVKLRITEGGRERIEERFFVRATAFPPPGAPQTTLAFGLRHPALGFELAGEPDVAAVQLSHRRRLSQHFGLGGSLYGRGEVGAVEFELGVSANGLQWSTAMLATTTREFVAATSLRAQSGAWRWFADARRVAAATAARFAEERFLGVREDFWQAALVASRSFGRARLQTTALWRHTDGGSKSWSVQPLLDWPLQIAGRRIALRVSAELGPEQRTVRVEFGVPTSRPNISARAGARLQRQGAATEVSPIYETEISDRWRVAEAAEIQGHLKWRQETDESVTATAQLQSDRGSALLSVQSDLDRRREIYFGNAQSGFAWTRAGLALATPAPGGAAVVYVNGTQSHNGPADALLSNVRIGTLEPRQKRIQPVPAFRKVSVGMLPARGASLSGDGRNRETTLFPGTVTVVATQFVQVAAAFGLLVELDGTPIGGATLTGSQGYAASDADGYFQLDVAAEEQIQVRRADGTTCRFRLAGPSADAAMIDAGQTVCLEAEGDTAPSASTGF